MDSDGFAFPNAPLSRLQKSIYEFFLDRKFETDILVLLFLVIPQPTMRLEFMHLYMFLHDCILPSRSRAFPLNAGNDAVF